MKLIASLVSVSMLLTPAAALSEQGFDVVVLGALGGIQDGNLSSTLAIFASGERDQLGSTKPTWSIRPSRTAMR
jgi:3',5'-cyclic-nucleotide phosphodiesterase